MFNHVKCEDVKYIKSGSHRNAAAIHLVKKKDLSGWLKTLNKEQKAWQKLNNFEAKTEEILVFSTSSGTIEMVALGLGSNEIDPWIIAKLTGYLPNGKYYIDNVLEDQEVNLAAFGWAIAQYSFDHYLKDKKKNNKILFVPKNCDLNHVNSQVRGTTLVRDLVNMPTCDLGPIELEDVAADLAKAFGARISVTTGDNLLTKNLNTIHTVGRAAEKAPRLIDMTWGDDTHAKVTLVGKGVCFDTGGLDIKPSGAMLTMKKDMGGAAHVLGLGQMIMESDLNICLRILIPAVENNIAGNAFRPGDIITSYEGTTIEVGNTDAEGRLVLCDALALASEEKPDLIIDFATLTGAARVALGADVPPFFTDDEQLNMELPKYSLEEHDPLWPLPLYEPYKKLLSSTVADLNNVASSGFGGAITAALFLKHFVGDNIPWIHFDVYAWNATTRPGRPKGGEAMGIRAIFEYLANKYKA